MIRNKKTTIVVFRHEGSEWPVLKVTESPDQVLIVIRSEPDEHITLHGQADGTVLFTHWSPDKPRKTADAARARIARKLGYRDPDRHAHYYAHWPLVLAEGMDGHHLVGRRIRIDAARPKAKYANTPRVTIDAPAREFMLTFTLATPEQPYSAPDEPHITTSFGDLYFRPEPAL